MKTYVFFVAWEEDGVIKTEEYRLCAEFMWQALEKFSEFDVEKKSFRARVFSLVVTVK